MPLLEEEKTELEDMSTDERDESDRLPQSASEKEGGGKTRAAAGVVAKVSSNTPLGKIAHFFSSNKRGTAIGGGILSSLIFMVVMFGSLIGPSQLVWMNSVFQGFNYDPYNRNVIRRAVAVKDAWTTNGDRQTRMAQRQATASANPAQAQRIGSTEPRSVSRLNRRVQHRFEIGNRINNVRQRLGKSPLNWRIFQGRSLSSPGAISPRLRLKGIVDQNRTPRTTRFSNTTEEINDASPNQRRGIARRFARASGITFTSAFSTLGCLAAYYNEMIPDEPDEIYELVMSYGAEFNTAGSQLAAGEDVHTDEVADAMDAYYDSGTLEAEEEEIDVYEEETNDDGETERVDRGTRTYAANQDAVEQHDRDFSQSAAWKVSTNTPLDGTEEDKDLEYGIDSMLSMSMVINSVGGWINDFSGGNATTACTILGAASIPLFIAEGIGTLKSGGTLQFIGRAVGFGIVVASIANLIEQVSFDQIMPDGPVMLFGMTGMSGNLTQSELARTQGSTPKTSDQMNTIRQAHFEKLAEEDRAKGFVWRYLSPDNPRSTLTTVAMTNNLNATSLLSSIVNIPRKLPELISGALFQPAQANQDFDNYNIEQFAPSERQLEIDVAQNDEYIEFIDGEEFDLGGSGYSCTYDSVDVITWNGLSEEEQQARRELGNGEIMRSNLLVFYNFEGPLDPDNPGAGPTECNTRRWRDAVLMYELINQCMTPEYYKMLEERGWSFNQRWDSPQAWMTPEQILNLPYIETNIANSDVRFLLPDNRAWERQFAWGTPFNAQDEIRPDTFGGFGGRLFRCNSESFAESIEFIDAWGRETNALEHWERVGVWRLDNEIVNNYICLSHDQPCDDSGAATTGAGGGAGGEVSELPSGEAASLAQQLLDARSSGDIGIDANPRSQLESVASGSNILDARILAVVLGLAQNHEFTVTSLERGDACNPSGSRHTCGLAADFSSSRGIDGVVYGYTGHNQTVQNFIDSAAELLLAVGSQNCGIGVPNQTYVNITSESYPACTVFVDKGSAPHIHIDIRQ